MNLLIDSGNTFTKVAFCEDDKIVEIVTLYDTEDFKKINKKRKPKTIIISSVNTAIDEIKGYFPDSTLLALDFTTPIPITNLYKTPSTLGMDRLAGVIGASSLYPNSPCLCIDAGTCITYDILDENANYLGGSISLGIEMRFKALHTFTSRLPLVSRHENVELIGNTSEGAILSGVQIGVLKEMEGIINEYKSKYKGLKIIITGGDSRFFESRIKDTIFAVPDLLFLGLKRILEYNVS